MTDKQVKFAKSLRSKIVVFSKNSLGLDLDGLHGLMESNGYGRSLSKLNLTTLISLWDNINGKPYKHEYVNFSNLDKTIYAKSKNIGLTNEKLDLFISKKWNKSGLKYLSKAEKGALISILNHYEQKL